MARRAWSTANYLGLASGIVTATPLTIAAWCKTSITGTQQTAVSVENSGVAAGREQFVLLTDTANHVTAQTGDAAANSAAVTSTTFSANVWMHACGVWASATDRRAFLNGGGKGTEATSRTPSGINQTTIGLIRQTTSVLPWAPAGTGDIAEVAVWNVALSDADVASLALGIHPFLVRPDALIAYWPLIGAHSPEINLKSNTTKMTMTGTLTQSAHARVFMPTAGIRR